MIFAKLLVVACTTIYTIELCVAERFLSEFKDIETDDEEKIKEALLLVELLKNEYAKKIKDVMKTHQVLRIGDTTIENSTCPITTLSEFEVQNATTTSTTITSESSTSTGTINITESTTETMPVHSTPKNQSEPQNMLPFRRSWPQAIMPQYEYVSQPPHNNIPDDFPNFYRRRNRFFRRKLPNYFYYYDEPMDTFAQKPGLPIYNNPPRPMPFLGSFRRFQNDIDLQPKSETTETSTTTDTTPSSTTSTTPSNVSNTATVPRKTTAKIQSTNLELSQSDNKKTTPIKKRHDKNKIPVVRAISDPTTGTPKNEVTDPIMAEVASEYLRELNGTKTTFKKGKKKRTTLRLYLESSTPYNLPLPANHAYCYTNPESALCRTFI